jgi:hypothetical protein
MGSLVFGVVRIACLRVSGFAYASIAALFNDGEP